MNTPSPRRAAERLLLAAAVGALAACNGLDSNSGNVDELFDRYTEGVETEVVEVAPDQWLIADERVVPDTNDTRVIARGLDGTIDTFSRSQLDQKPSPATASTPEEARRESRHSGFGGILLYGLIGRQLFGGGFMGTRSNAYVNSAAYNRVQQSTGQRLNTGLRSGGGPRGGRSGFGAGRATRGFGG